MQVGTQILIDRMKQFPEEFKEGEICKWSRHISYAMEWLPEEDKQALREAINERRLGEFNEGVLRTLAGDEEEYPATLRYQTKERYAGGFTDPKGIFGSAPVKAEGHSAQYDHATDSYKYLTVTGRK